MPRHALTLVLAAALLAAALSTAAAPAARAADMTVDLELVLAVDVSFSMDSDEQQLQRDGYVAAITNPDVIAAIGRGLNGRIALSYVEWAGPEMQHTVVDWRVVDGAASAEAFAAALAEAPMEQFRGTSISGSLAFLRPRFDGNGYDAPRRVIDVSGDGPNNMGMPIEAAREQVVGAGITINGLPIMIKQPGGFAAIGNLDVYYEDCVIGGAGAFVIVVRSADQFAEAIRRKLMLEIADRAPRLLPAAAPTSVKRIDCLIGEKLRRQWMSE
jgi:hypothetical protein